MKNFLKELFELGDSTKVSLPAKVYVNSDYIKGKPPIGVLYQKNNHLHLFVGDTSMFATQGNIFLD